MAGENEIESRPEYVPVRVSQLPKVGQYKDQDRVLLARPRSGQAEGPNMAYTTVTQALSALSSQLYGNIISAAGAALSVITDRQAMRDLGDEDKLKNSLSVANAHITYLIDSDIRDAAKISEKNHFLGENTFSRQPHFTGDGSYSTEGLDGTALVTYGQVSAYVGQAVPVNGVVYSSQTQVSGISSWGSRASSKYFEIPETYSYTAQRDCEVHFSLESFSSSKIQPSSMSIWVTLDDGSELPVYRFADNDSENYVAYYWAHAVKKGTKITFKHVKKKGNGWYLRYIREVW